MSMSEDVDINGDVELWLCVLIVMFLKLSFVSFIVIMVMNDHQQCQWEGPLKSLPWRLTVMGYLHLISPVINAASHCCTKKVFIFWETSKWIYTVQTYTIHTHTLYKHSYIIWRHRLCITYMTVVLFHNLCALSHNLSRVNQQGLFVPSIKWTNRQRCLQTFSFQILKMNLAR